jgi:hypothetical protein
MKNSLTVGELIAELRKFPVEALVYMYSPYDDPDLGPVNGGGPIEGVRIGDPRPYGETIDVIELWWEGF